MSEDQVPEFLLRLPDEGPVVTEDTLTKITDLVKKQKLLEAEIIETEKKLDFIKKVRDKIAREYIPELLGQTGLSDIRLKNGTRVKVEEKLSVSVPETKQPYFFKFLRDHKNDDIIKTTISLDTMPAEKLNELYDFLAGYDYSYSAEQKVHASTLASYMKKLLGVGVDREERDEGIAKGKYLTKEQVAEFANVFVYYDTKLTDK